MMLGCLQALQGKKVYYENNDFFVAVGSQTYKVLKTL